MTIKTTDWAAIVEHAQREVELVRRRLDELTKLGA